MCQLNYKLGGRQNNIAVEGQKTNPFFWSDYELFIKSFLSKTWHAVFWLEYFHDNDIFKNTKHLITILKKKKRRQV